MALSVAVMDLWAAVMDLWVAVQAQSAAAMDRSVAVQAQSAAVMARSGVARALSEADELRILRDPYFLMRAPRGALFFTGKYTTAIRRLVTGPRPIEYLAEMVTNRRAFRIVRNAARYIARHRF